MTQISCFQYLPYSQTWKLRHRPPAEKIKFLQLAHELFEANHISRVLVNILKLFVSEIKLNNN